MNTRRLNGVKMNRATFNAIGEVTKKKAEGGGGGLKPSDAPNGVYIQHIKGGLYTTDEWTAKAFANDEANGVAVVADEASFVISKGAMGATIWADVRDVLIEGADNGMDGYSNTQAIIKNTTNGAAHWCADYEFPNGSKGYLASKGEWGVAYSNKADIDEIMALIGGGKISQTNLWTSNQMGAKFAYQFSWGKGTTEGQGKGNNGYPRPFTKLK